METYELWRMAMYAVGVFVTCNVGGAALRMGARRLTRRRLAPMGRVRVGVNTQEGMKVLTDPEEIAEFLSGLSGPDRDEARKAFHEAHQTFEEIRRQVDGSTTKPEPEKPANEEKDFFSD